MGPVERSVLLDKTTNACLLQENAASFITNKFVTVLSVFHEERSEETYSDLVSFFVLLQDLGVGWGRGFNPRRPGGGRGRGRSSLLVHSRESKRRRRGRGLLQGVVPSSHFPEGQGGWK